MQHTLTFITETKHCCKTMLTPSLCVMHSLSTLFHQKFFSGDPLNWFQSSQVMAYILETCSKGSMWVQESSGRGWTSQNASLPCSLPVWVCIFSFWLSAMKRNYRPNRSWRSVGTWTWCAGLCLVAQSCPTLCDPMDCSPSGSSILGDSQGKNAGVGFHALLQGIFPTQG